MTAERIKIAYIAPEIPALSATFVTAEILQLETIGFEVLPVSVRRPQSLARGEAEDALAGRTRVLYETPVSGMLRESLLLLLQAPARFGRTMLTALADACSANLSLRTRMGQVFRFMAAGKLARILRQSGCRHLHAHFAHVPTDLAMYAAQLAGISFSFTAHANDLFQRGWLLRQKVERACFAVPISRYNREFLIQHGAPAHKIKVIHCGVDSDRFSPDFSPQQGPVPKIGTLGRLVEKKGCDALLNACGMLQARGVPFHLEIAGDGPERLKLEAIAADLDLAGKVTFIGGFEHSRVAAWMKGLDLFVLACQKDSAGDIDGIPVVLMEAMAGGTAVVSTRISGIPELIEDGVSGALARPGDAQDIAEAVSRMLTDAAFRERCRRSAVPKVAAEFNLAANVRSLSQLFKEAIA
jgi:colanic acid/amylovoran biosynthesis glycosyltransferase